MPQDLGDEVFPYGTQVYLPGVGWVTSGHWYHLLWRWLQADNDDSRQDDEVDWP